MIEAIDVTRNVTINAEIIDKITFASQQNDVAIINQIVIHNLDETEIETLTLKLTSSPEIILERSWSIDRISAGGELRLRDRKVDLAASMLHQLTEKMTAEIKLELYQDDQVISSTVHKMDVLARHEWGGANYMPELLAAFVMPNDPAVEAVIKEASHILRKAGENPAMDGYQSKSRKRVFTIASAIWSAVASKRLTYAVPPASFERQGQKIRTPSHIWESGLATCLDTTILFAAALEQAGLHALISFTEGHAFCGAWLQPQYLPTLTTDDPVEVRKHIAAKELILFETTLITSEPPARFKQALKQGEANIEEDVEDSFIYALDMKQARARGISPLPSFDGTLQNQNAGVEESYDQGLDAAPDLPSFDFGIEIHDNAPDTPETRLDHWRRKLLDLTKRNRLLNLRPTKTAIKLVCPDPAELEDKLADSQKITVIPKETLSGEQGGRDEELFKKRTGADYLREFAKRSMERNQIVADSEARDLERGMIELYRKSHADIREGGANTLFLAIGVLRWRQSEDDPKSYRAPLLLIPVKLERKSARSKVKIIHHDDEPVFNMTLLEMLRQDFEVEIPALSGELPKDDSGVDVPLVWEIVRRSVKEIPGFEVREEVVLSTFSFAKYLMWKDLSDRVDVLKQNNLVEHLIETPRDEYDYQADFIEPGEIDQYIAPGDLFMPLPADSSQIVAVNTSGRQSDFILEGPPGTGKSQTIANMIAHNLALGRKVLFVSEKMAALEVVYNRLKQHGLGDFCLELHSNKTNKKAVIDHLGNSWKNRQVLSVDEWRAEAGRLKELRDSLNRVVQAVHEPAPSGLSPYKAIGRAVRYKEHHRLSLKWISDPLTSIDDRLELEQLVVDLSTAFSEVRDLDPGALDLIQNSEWSYAWKARIVNQAGHLRHETETLSETFQKISAWIGISEDGLTYSKCNDLVEPLNVLLGLIESAINYNLELAFDSELDDISEAINKACQLVKKYRETEKRLSKKLDEETVKSISAADLKEQWNKAETKLFPIKFFKHYSLKKQLFLQSGNAGLSPAADLSVIIELQGYLADLEVLEKEVPASVKWQGLTTDIDKVAMHVDALQRLRKSVTGFAADLDGLVSVKTALKKLFVDGRELLSAGSGFEKDANTYLNHLAEYQTRMKKFKETSHVDCDDLPFVKLSEKLQNIIDLQPRLNAWCRWYGLKVKAVGNHLSDLVDGLENKIVTHDDALESFKTAYAMWLAPRLIDSRDELRQFSSLHHEGQITRFRELDEKVSKLSVDYIRARLSGDLPAEEGRKLPAGYKVLRHQMQLKQPRIAVRQLVSELDTVLTDLTPCMLMSPLSIAQFLPPDVKLFDLVIFDEASQITVWDAIGSIARAKNVIIVGDPKQMPPTSFFDRGADDNDDDSDSILIGDQESILTEALSAGVKHHRLTGHYRSRHESLIAFSNHAYYNGDLITYPACNTKESAVTLKHVEDGLYQRGKRINEKEAKAVVAEVVRRLNDPELCQHSIGIVTMNTEQQRFINDLLDAERRKNPSLEPYFNEDNSEHIFVRNLETVQGDERNVIMISIGFGPTEPGAQKMSMSFGALNRKGGERRLNVLITRASEEKIIFCSFESSMIDLTRTSAQAVHDLKHYLEFAERGPRALGEAVTSIGGLTAYDSDFERAVAEGLRSRGWTVHTQIGVSRFRVDLGIVRPDRPGEYLVGVECDGATYHSLPAARDRDRVRHAILENLGWTLHRLWSTDFFQDPEGALDRLSDKLQQTLDGKVLTEEQERNRRQDEMETLKEEAPFNEMRDVLDGQVAHAVTAHVDDPLETTVSDLQVSTHIPDQEGLTAVLSPDRFYEDTYRAVIRSYAAKIIDEYGPITFKGLADKIARDHGFKRTAVRISGVIMESIKGLRVQIDEVDDTQTLWPEGREPITIIEQPRLHTDGERRVWQDFSYPEKLGLVKKALEKKAEDTPREMANILGMKRLAGSTKQEFEKTIEALKAMSGDQ